MAARAHASRRRNRERLETEATERRRSSMIEHLSHDEKIAAVHELQAAAEGRRASR
jgi:hypothetical protein